MSLTIFYLILSLKSELKSFLEYTSIIHTCIYMFNIINSIFKIQSIKKTSFKTVGYFTLNVIWQC